jgi:hypothetical protein
MLVEVRMSLLLNNKRRRGSVIANVDPYWDNVVLFLKGDGENDSTDIIDSSPNPKTVDRFGNAKISTAQSKYGGSSLYFGVSNDYLSISNIGTNDPFTLECWVYFTANANEGIFQFGVLNNTNTNLWGAIVSSVLRIYRDSTSIIDQAVSLNTWYHVAVVRDTSNLKMYFNGILDSQQPAYSSALSGLPLIIGTRNSTSFGLTGYLDSIRLTNLVRYTTNFNPETDTYLDS